MSSFLVGLLLVVSLPLSTFTSYGAATARIAFSDPTTKVGEEVGVKMKFTCTSGETLGNTDVMLAYDPTLLEYINETENASGGNGAIRVWNGVQDGSEAETMLYFKALQAGTAVITITTWEGYDNNNNALDVQQEGTSTVTIEGLATSSTDATLKSLQISPGTLDPAFTPAVESYETKVDLTTDKITISAVANNSGAKVLVEGNEGLQEGENTVTCTVTAENGTSTKTYTILVNKVENLDEGTETETETQAAFDVLATLESSGIKIQIVEIPDDVQIPDGLKESSIAIGETAVQGWVLKSEASPQNCIVYAMNENSEFGFYSYDLTEKTLQRYFGTATTDADDSTEQFVTLAKDYNSLLDSYNMIRMVMFALIGLSIVLIIVVCVILVGKKNVSYEESESEEELPSAIPAKVTIENGRKMTREERYMAGVEEQYEEEDLPRVSYQPEEVIEEIKEDIIEEVQEVQEDFEFIDL